MTTQSELPITAPGSVIADIPATRELVGQLIERPQQFGTLALDSPQAVLTKAAEVATALQRIIVAKELFKRIRDKDFVFVEGWTTLGAMLGVGVKELETIESATKPGEFIARVEAIRLSDGMIIGGASASCGPDEKEWAGRTRQARRSMALTRATGKSLRLLFSWVMTLAGYAVTPWEEIEGELAPPLHENPTQAQDAPRAAPRGQRAGKVQASDVDAVVKQWKAYLAPEGTKAQFGDYVRKVTGTTFEFEKLAPWEPHHLAAVKEALDKCGP